MSHGIKDSTTKLITKANLGVKTTNYFTNCLIILFHEQIHILF